MILWEIILYVLNLFLGDYGVANSHQPVFFVRDPIRFPSLNRSHKRHPATNRPDWNMVCGSNPICAAKKANLS